METFRRTPFKVPAQTNVPAQADFAVTAEEQIYTAPEVDPYAPVNAWWVVSVYQGTMEVHIGAGFETFPYVLAPGGVLRISRTVAPQIRFRNYGETDVLGVLVYTSDPAYIYTAVG